MADATMADVFKFFADGTDYKMSEFRNDWKELTDQDKADLKAGIGNGSLTY
jgi:hypothetical protein